MTREWPKEVEDFLALDADQQADQLLWGIYHAPENEQGQNFIHFRLGEWFPDLTGLAGLRSNVPARPRQRQERRWTRSRTRTRG